MQIEETQGEISGRSFHLTTFKLDADWADISAVLSEVDGAKDKVRKIGIRKTNEEQRVSLIVSTSFHRFSSVRKAIAEHFESDAEFMATLQPGQLKIFIFALSTGNGYAIKNITLSNSSDGLLVKIPDDTHPRIQYSLVTFFVLALYSSILLGLYIYYFHSATQPGSLVSEILFYYPMAFIFTTIFGVPISFLILFFSSEWFIRRRSRPKER